MLSRHISGYGRVGQALSGFESAGGGAGGQPFETVLLFRVADTLALRGRGFDFSLCLQLS